MVSEASYDYFLDNREKWLAESPGFYVVIKNGAFCAMYHDALATEANAPKYGDNNNLLIMHLDPQGVKEYKLIGLKEYKAKT